MEKTHSKVQCLYQTPSMSEQEREDFLEQFQEEGEETLAGFCVMGGIFSEGIDLAGKKTHWCSHCWNWFASGGK